MNREDYGRDQHHGAGQRKGTYWDKLCAIDLIPYVPEGCRLLTPALTHLLLYHIVISPLRLSYKKLHGEEGGSFVFCMNCLLGT